MVELYINDELVELIGNESIASDYALLDINDIGKRKSVRGYPFGLPKTNINKTIFESPEIINNLSRIPYIKLKARLYVDGVDSNIKFASLESINQRYNIRLYGANSDFFFDAKGVMINDLDFCEFDHFWTLPNVVASRLNNSGYIYPVIDYQTDSPLSGPVENPTLFMDNIVRQMDVRFMLPGMYWHTILEKLAAHFGITVNNEVLKTINYPDDKLLYPFSKTTKVRNRQPDRYTAIFSASQDLKPNTDVLNAPGFINPGVYVTLDTVTPECGSYWTNGNWKTDRVKFAEKVRFKLKYNLILAGDFHYQSFVLFATNYNATTDFSLITPTNFHEEPMLLLGPGFADTVITGEKVFETVVFDNHSPLFNIDNQLFIFYLWSGGQPNPVTVREGSTIEITDVEILQDGEVVFEATEQQKNYITMSTMIPDMTCADFILQYCLQFGAIPIVNYLTGVLNIIPFDTIKNNLSKAVDWTNKVDASFEEELTFEYLDHAQKNILKYADDGNVIKPEGTDGEILIDNENLEKEKIIVELTFGATETAERLIGIQIPHIKVWDQFGANFGSNVLPRVLVMKKYANIDFIDTSPLRYNIENASFSDVNDNWPIPYFIKSDEAFNLGFGNNLVDLYYTLLTSIISNIKNKTVGIRLNISDINQLNFLYPVFLQQDNAYYYISAIRNFEYTSPKTTEVELIKLNVF